MRFPIRILILVHFLLESSSAYVFVTLERCDLWTVKIFDWFQGPFVEFGSFEGGCF